MESGFVLLLGADFHSGAAAVRALREGRMTQPERSDSLTPSAQKVLQALPDDGERITWDHLLTVLRPMNVQGLARAVNQLVEYRLAYAGGWNGRVFGWVKRR